MIDTSHPVRVHVGSSLAFVDIVNTIDTDMWIIEPKLKPYWHLISFLLLCLNMPSIHLKSMFKNLLFMGSGNSKINFSFLGLNRQFQALCFQDSLDVQVFGIKLCDAFKPKICFVYNMHWFKKVLKKCCLQKPPHRQSAPQNYVEIDSRSIIRQIFFLSNIQHQPKLFDLSLEWPSISNTE
jgi:hypothetical protein